MSVSTANFLISLLSSGVTRIVKVTFSVMISPLVITA